MTFYGGISPMRRAASRALAFRYGRYSCETGSYGGDLVLRQWSGSAETVPQPDDLALTRAERGEERTVHRIIAVMIVHSVQTFVIAADRILKRKRIAVAVGLERIRERDLTGRSALAAEVPSAARSGYTWKHR